MWFWLANVVFFRRFNKKQIMLNRFVHVFDSKTHVHIHTKIEQCMSCTHGISLYEFYCLLKRNFGVCSTEMFFINHLKRWAVKRVLWNFVVDDEWETARKKWLLYGLLDRINRPKMSISLRLCLVSLYAHIYCICFVGQINAIIFIIRFFLFSIQ